MKNQKQAEQHKKDGNQAFMASDFSCALTSYSKAIELAEEPNAIFYANRANVYLAQKEYQKAVDDCIEALKINPDYSKASYRLAKAYYALEQFPEADAAIK